MEFDGGRVCAFRVHSQSLEMSKEMRSVRERPYEVTMLSLLSAYVNLGDLDVGQKICGSLLEMFIGDLNVLLDNLLIDSMKGE